MNSLFLRLYLLIVATVLLVGIGLDFVWQHFDEKPAPFEQHQTVLNIVSIQLDNLDTNQLTSYLDELNTIPNGEFSLVSSSSPLALSVSQELENNPYVFMQSDNEIIGFRALHKHPQILQLTLLNSAPNKLNKNLLVGLFYGLIALVIFYWIWPLSKDLNRLEKAVKQFDQQQWQSKVEIPTTSSISHLAQAYNGLLDKIKLLIESQQAMSHSISHELRTPLARIRFSLQMAEESDDIGSIREQIRSIDEDISEMNNLINELLNFASLENISSVAKIEKGDINTLIETLLQRLTRNDCDRIIKYNNDSLNSSVSCDSYLIERAIQNLLVNACKFSKKNIMVTFKEHISEYEIAVEDDGKGVEKEYRHKIFESFYQLDNQDKNKGFGLGLAIVKRVMALHKGQAYVESSQLGGAKFMLRWPK